MEKLIERLQNEIPHLQNRKEMLKDILSLLDLTTLEGTDNKQVVDKLCDKALSFKNKNLPYPAAICVYPPFANQVKQRVQQAGINVACVAGAFPSGQSPLNLRVEEVKYAVAQGADEIDMVISRGEFLAGNTAFVKQEVAEIKKACGKAHLKVILETGELGSVENITHASELAIEAGADFIKTSTGKIQPAATPLAMATMLQVIKNHYSKTGIKIGIKPAGGISTPDVALLYYLLVKEILGDQWLNNKLFRIGASRLADKIVEEVAI